MLVRLAIRRCCRQSSQSLDFRHPDSYRTCSSSSFYLRDEVVSVPVGANGHVDLRITRPTISTSSSNVLVHLPAGPYPRVATQAKNLTTARDLSKHFPDTIIVDLQYRLAARNSSKDLDNRFPTPVHDVFAAWDAIYERFLDPDHDGTLQTHVQNAPKIGLYGSHIGAALAMGLALTNPNQIHAVAIEDPLIDWPILDEIAADASKIGKTRKSARSEALAAAAGELIKLRTSLFRTPSGYFDPFASPTLFLRAPGRDTPLTKTAAPEVLEGQFEGAPIRYGDGEEDVGMVEYDRDDYGPYDDDWHATDTKTIRNREYRIDEDGGLSVATSDSTVGSDNGSNAVADNKLSQDAVASARRRKVLRRWPPIGYPEEVSLPYIHVSLSSQKFATADTGDIDIGPVTRLQGLELVDLLRRACFWGKDKSFAEEYVFLRDHQKLDTDNEYAIATITWLRDRLNTD